LPVRIININTQQRLNQFTQTNKLVMKKIVLFIFICSFTYATLQAQGVRYGFKLGINASSINNLDFELVNVGDGTALESLSENEEGRINVTAGFFADLPINEKISFQPEVLFSSQGNKGEGFNTDYLQMPLGFRFSFNKLFVVAGPQVGLKISFFEQSNDYASFDFSAFGGVGYQVTQSLFLEARYTLGFVEIFENDADIPIEATTSGGDIDLNTRYRDLSGNNSYLSVVLGYRL
jgi:hypothetical protein